MSDLISREDAIRAVAIAVLDDRDELEAIKALPSVEAVKAVKDCRNCKHGGYNDHWKTWFCYNNLECSNWGLWEPAEAVQGWIPCSERLPEIDETLRLCDQISEEVIGTDTYGNIRHVYLTNSGYLKPTFCTVEEGMSVDIVAWMPLPKPYKGGDSE